MQIARTSRRGITRPSNEGSAGMRDNGENLGGQTSARLDRLAVLRSGAEGSGALGRHQHVEYRNYMTGRKDSHKQVSNTEKKE